MPLHRPMHSPSAKTNKVISQPTENPQTSSLPLNHNQTLKNPRKIEETGSRRRRDRNREHTWQKLATRRKAKLQSPKCTGREIMRGTLLTKTLGSNAQSLPDEGEIKRKCSRKGWISYL